MLLFLIILCGLQVGANLLMMQAFQGIIDRNMEHFLRWTLLLVPAGFWRLVFDLRTDKCRNLFSVPRNPPDEQRDPPRYLQHAVAKKLSTVSPTIRRRIFISVYQ